MRRRPQPVRADRRYHTASPRLRANPQVRGRARLAAAAVAAAALLAAGCGSQRGPSGSTLGSEPSITATAPAPPKATCGEARTAANVPVVVEVEKGPVSCAVAMRVQRGYTTLVQEGRVRGNGGGAPVTVDGWTCQGETTPVIVQTGEVSACRQGTAEIITILKLPGGSG